MSDDECTELPDRHPCIHPECEHTVPDDDDEMLGGVDDAEFRRIQATHYARFLAALANYGRQP